MRKGTAIANAIWDTGICYTNGKWQLLQKNKHLFQAGACWLETLTFIKQKREYRQSFRREWAIPLP
jgi:hypothetical protein